MARLELPLSDDDWPYVDCIPCDQVLDPNSEASVEARRRLAVFGCVAFSGIVSKEHCRDMRRDMWQHVEQIAPGFSREDPSTWEHWKKRGNYGMPGKKTIFTAPFLQLRQSRRLAACFGTLMQERPEDLIVSHDRWLLYLKTLESAGSSSVFKTRRNIHLDLNPWEYVESDPRVFEDLANLTYSSSRDFTRELNAGHAMEGPELPEALQSERNSAFKPETDANTNVSGGGGGGGDGGGGGGGGGEDGDGGDNTNVEAGALRPRRLRLGGLSLQGLVNLRDNRPEDGGTLVVPRPPSKFEEWVAGLPDTQRTRGAMQFHVPEDDPLQAHAQRAPLREGCVLIWDRRTVHGAAPNASDRCRFGVPVTFTRRVALQMFPTRAQGRAAALAREIVKAGFVESLSPHGVRVFGLDLCGKTKKLAAEVEARQRQLMANAPSEATVPETSETRSSAAVDVDSCAAAAK